MLEDALRRKSRWLRFEPRLERIFQRDIAAARTARIALCNALGGLFNWLNTLNENEVFPTLTSVLTPLRFATFAFVLLGAALLFWKRKVSPVWIVDGVTVFGSLLIVAYVLIAAHHPPDQLQELIRMGGISLLFLHAGLAARLQFRSVLGLGLATIAGYALAAVGHETAQKLVIAANLRLFVTTLGYVLVTIYLLERRERRNYVRQRLQRHRHLALVAVAEALQRLSLSDALTGLHNRRRFDEAIVDAWREGAARGEALAVLQIDVDHFKRYNDHYGHPAGDLCLQRVAQALSAVAGQYSALAARVGGEEFAMLLPRCTLETAAQVAETVLRTVRALELPHPGSLAAEHVTVSIGAAAVQAPVRMPSVQALLFAADTALYAAKHSGRDRTCLAPLVPDSTSKVAASRPMREQPGVSNDEVLPTALPPPPPTPLPTPPPTSFAATRTSAADDRSVALRTRIEALQAVLSIGFRRLRFPDAIEAQYAVSSASNRGVFLFALGAAGLLFALAYLRMSSALIADVADRIAPFQLWTAAILTPAILALLRPMSSRCRESLFGICVVALTLGTALLISQSRLMTAHTYAMSLFLIPMFSAIIAAQPFRYGACVSVVAWVLVVLATAPKDDGQRSLWIDVSRMGLNGCLFSLIGGYLIEWSARRDHLFKQIAEAQGALLAHSTELLRQLADRDPLTGLPNRRKFDAELAARFAACAAAGQPLALLIADVDHFKRYNDSLGHAAGDGCLQQVANSLVRQAALQSAAAGIELVAARIGGEEFALLLPAHDAAAALAVAQAVCAAIRGLELRHPDSPVAPCVTASIGVASVRPALGDTAVALMRRADEALYAAKHQGRNRAQHLCRVVDEGERDDQVAAMRRLTPLSTPMSKLETKVLARRNS